MKANRNLAGVVTAMIAAAAPIAAHATYNANINDVISNVRVYDDGLVLLRVQNQPTTHPACNPNYFAIDNTLDPDIRAMLLSRALIAKSSGEITNIGYDGLGSCARGYMRVHQIGN